MTFIIYSKTGCDYCEKSKLLLNNLEHVIINCDQMLKNNRSEFIKSMELKTHEPFRTFPIIFCDDIYIGGYDDLHEYLTYHNIEFDDDF